MPFLFRSACTWIASKLEDEKPPQASDLVYISDHSFPSEKLRNLEKRIMNRLNFGLHRVTPMHFVNQFLRASHACQSSSCVFDHPILSQMTMYLLELSRISFDLSYRPPSLIAASAVYLARVTLGMQDADNRYWTKTLAYTTGYSVQELQDTVLLMHKYHMSASSNATTNASYLKFRRYETYYAVALKPAVRLDELTDFDLDGAMHEDVDFGLDHPDSGV